MRSASLTIARVALIAGPVALAFASGGYFAPARLVALVVAWAVVALCAVAAPRPLPRLGAARLTLLAFALLAGWIALSQTWAPLDDPANGETQLVLLYLATLLAATAAFVPRASMRALEPLVGLGALVVVAYGLSGRLLPGIVEMAHSRTAGGRLEQPLTYWNGMGLLATMGLLIAARLAGDRTRADGIRLAAAAAAAPLGMAIYLSFSRGALVALAVGVVVLLMLTPTWGQLRAAAITVEAAVLGAFVGGVFPAVRTLDPGQGSATTQGALALVALAAVVLGAVLLTRWDTRVEASERVRLGALPLPRWSTWAGIALIVVMVGAPMLVARASSDDQAAFGATSSRFSEVGSNRYRYWHVALDTFEAHPIEGIGAGGWVVDWLKHRTIDETVRQPHSLWLQTLAELGIVGLALLLLAVAGLALAARRAHGRDPTAVSGAIAVLAAWAIHASFDWDWQLPAVTLPAVVLAGALLAQASREDDPESALDPEPAFAPIALAADPR